MKGDGGRDKVKDGRAGREISLPAAAAPSLDPSSPIADYLTHLEKERDVSPNTVIAYRRDLEEFVAFLGAYYSAREWSWQGLDRLAIRGFLAHLTRKKLNKRSIARALSAVRSFYKYLHRNELVDANPARAVNTPKQDKYLPAYLDRAQIDLLFQSAELKAQEGKFSDVRNCAILELFYSTGMDRCPLQRAGSIGRCRSKSALRRLPVIRQGLSRELGYRECDAQADRCRLRIGRQAAPARARCAGARVLARQTRLQEHQVPDEDRVHAAAQRGILVGPGLRVVRRHVTGLGVETRLAGLASTKLKRGAGSFVS